MHDGINNLKAIRKPLLKRVQLVTQHQLGIGIGTEKEFDLCFLFSIVENPLDQLEHWSDANAAGDQVYLMYFVCLPSVTPDGPHDGKFIARLEAVEMATCAAIGISLDEELDVSRFGWQS